MNGIDTYLLVRRSRSALTRREQPSLGLTVGATIDFAVSCAPPRGPPKRYGPPGGGVSVYRGTRCAVSMKLVGSPEDPITGPRYAGGLSARGTLRRGFPGLSLAWSDRKLGAPDA